MPSSSPTKEQTQGPAPSTSPATAGVYLRLFLVPLFWSGNFIVGKWLAQALSPLDLSVGRWTVALLILVPLVIWREKGWPKPGRDQLGALAFLGFSGIFAFNTLLYLALHYTSATNATLINSFIPVVSLFLGAIVLGEPIGVAQVAGSLLSILGVGLILVQGAWQNLLAFRLNPGDLLMLLDTLAWAAYTVIGKKVMHRLSPLVATTYAVIFGLLFLYPTWIVEKFLRLPRGWHPGWGISLLALLGIVYVGLFASVLAFLWWYEGARAIGAGRTSIFANLLPLYAALLAVVFLGEKPAWFHLVGGIILVGGVTLAVQPGPQKS